MTSVALPAQSLAPTVWQLARVEGMRMLRHPVVLVGLGLSVAFTLLNEWDSVGGDYFAVTGPGLLPLLVSLVAANLAALRSRRSDTDELYASLPSPARARTLAQLASLAWLAAGTAVFVGVFFVAFGGLDGFVVTYGGDTAVPSVGELAQGPLAIATVAALGIALARWIPFLPVAPVAAAGLTVVSLPATTWNLQGAWVWFLPLVNAAETSPDTSFPCARSGEATVWCGEPAFLASSAVWHVVYLAGLGVAFAAAALLRDDRRPSNVALAAAGVAAAVVAGALQIP